MNKHDQRSSCHKEEPHSNAKTTLSTVQDSAVTMPRLDSPRFRAQALVERSFPYSQIRL